MNNELIIFDFIVILEDFYTYASKIPTIRNQFGFKYLFMKGV